MDLLTLRNYLSSNTLKRSWSTHKKQIFLTKADELNIFWGMEKIYVVIGALFMYKTRTRKTEIEREIVSTHKRSSSMD